MSGLSLDLPKNVVTERSRSSADLALELMGVMGRHHGFGRKHLRRVGGVEVHGYWLLGEVRMLFTFVDLELGGHLAAEFGLGQHALDGLFDDGFGATGEKFDEGLFAEAAGESSVATI